MIEISRTSFMTLFTPGLLLASASLGACAESDDDDGETQPSATATSSAMGAGAAPPVDTTSMDGPSPSDVLDPSMCMDVVADAPCDLIGTCHDLICGIADTGTYHCLCDETWRCISCVFPMGDDRPRVLEPPTDEYPIYQNCPADFAVGGICDAATAIRCVDPTNAEHICVCHLQDDEGNTVWDCDEPPGFWFLPWDPVPN